jgi:hypothetical protein
MSPSCKRSFLFPAALCAVTLGAPAAAQDVAQSEALFKRGLADMEAGRYETGCKALAESLRIDLRAGTLFTLATCEGRWGHLATAVTRYNTYLALYERLPDSLKAVQGERPKVARAQRDQLAQQVPELTVSLSPDTPPGTVVTRDGQILAEAALGVGFPVDPGEHTVTAQAPGGATAEQRITLGKGEKKKLVMEAPAVPRAEPVAPGPSAPAGAPVVAEAGAGPSGRRVATYVIGGVGVAGLALGGVMGGLALGRKSVIQNHCGSAIGSKDPSACDGTGLAAANSAKTLSVGSTVGFAAGGAVAAAALVLLLTEPRPARPAASKRGPWVSIAISPAGYASVMAEGAW